MALHDIEEPFAHFGPGMSMRGKRRGVGRASIPSAADATLVNSRSQEIFFNKLKSPRPLCRSR
eukprot:2924592-Amphidinium_carterae.1